MEPGSRRGVDVGTVRLVKRLLYIVGACFVIASPPTMIQAQQKTDPIFGIDKVKHFFIAGFVESMTFAGLQAAGSNRSTARTAAIGTTAVVSFGRELHGRRTNGQFSVKDLVWDALGAGAALLIINKTR